MAKRQRTVRPYLSLWFAVLWGVGITMIGVLPLRNFVGHSHWEYIVWIPSLEQLISRRNVFDMGANAILFMPFGLSLAQSIDGSAKRKLVVAVAIASCLSMSIEFYQVYCHNRHPSIIDILTNTMGSLIGATIAVARARIRHSATTLTPNPPARTLVP